MFWKIAAASNRKLPAETAHNVAVQAMRIGLVPQTDIAAFPHLQCGFKGLHFEILSDLLQDLIKMLKQWLVRLKWG